MHKLRIFAREIVSKYRLTPQGRINMAQFRGSVFEFRPYPDTRLYNWITGKEKWPQNMPIDHNRLVTYGEEEILTSFKNVFMEGLDVRQKHNYTNDLLFSDVDPTQIQEMIREAMISQRDDLQKHGEYIPDLIKVTN